MEGTLSTCWAPNKVQFMFPWSSHSEKKKSCSDPQNNPKRAMGRFDNGTVHWERAKGLKSPSYKAAYRESIIPCLSHATCSGSLLSFPHWIVFSHLLLQMFQGHWKLESPVSDRAGEQIGGGLRGIPPEGGALLLNTPVVSQSLEAKNAKPRHAAVIDCD